MAILQMAISLPLTTGRLVRCKLLFQLLETLPVVSHVDFYACGEGSTVMKVEMTARRHRASLRRDQ